MATKLDKTLIREVSIDGQAHTLTLSPEGIKLTTKRSRRPLVSRTWSEMAKLADSDPKGGPDE